VTSFGPRSRVLIAGGGVAALEAALALEHLAGQALDLHLIAPEREFVYRPLAVGEPFGWSVVSRRPIADLAPDRLATHLGESVARVLPQERRAVTTAGTSFDYDALLLATGARARNRLPGALCFGGPESVDQYRRLLQKLDDGSVQRLAFVLPPLVAWGLPLYELALMTAMHLFERRVAGVELTLATYEDAPLAAFGTNGSGAIARLLEDGGIALELGVSTASVHDVDADAVVTVPELRGPRLEGLPHDEQGFVPVDEHCRVRGVDAVWAAGDVTVRPMKQGGLATQQADAAAESIAAWAGSMDRPTPYRPVLRGLLLSGEQPEQLHADLDAEAHGRFAIREEPGWWPPAKIAGRYLTPVLAAHAMDQAGRTPPALTPDR
jgi:sulfide:quinone oxidoreductase